MLANNEDLTWVMESEPPAPCLDRKGKMSIILEFCKCFYISSNGEKEVLKEFTLVIDKEDGRRWNESNFGIGAAKFARKKCLLSSGCNSNLEHLPISKKNYIFQFHFMTV